MTYKRYSINTVLKTRDGRKIGNAIIIGYEQGLGSFLNIIKTDYGDILSVENKFIEEMFHPVEAMSQLTQDRIKNHKHWVGNS